MRIVIFAVLIAFVIWWALRDSELISQQDDSAGAALVTVVMPTAFSTAAQAGASLFSENCLACHGKDASGKDGVAPPLIHKIYEPSHHGDESFQRAVALGVRQHHWRFGNMPKIDGLDRNEVQKIVAYIREIQRANGIY